MEQKYLNEVDGHQSDVPSTMTHINQPQSTLEKMYFVVSPVKLKETLTTLLWGKRG
jgi:hypothetical protein